MITFSEVPSNARVPGVYIEIDNSLANTDQGIQKVIIIGKAVEGAKVAPNNVVLSLNKETALTEFGNGEILEMVDFFTKQDKTMPIYAVSVEGNDVSSALAALGDTQYHHLICSLNDDLTVRTLTEFLESRYTAMEQIPGIAYIAKKGTHAELVTFGATVNCPLISIMPINALSHADKTLLSDAAALAALAGQIAPSLANDPCRPLQTLKLNGVYSIASSEFDWSERNLLLHEGIGTYTVSATSEVFIERPVTTYTENESGVADDSYLDVMTIATAMFFREKQRSRILSKYPRHKLAGNDSRFDQGQAIVTPNMIKSELLALYSELEYKGIVQDMAGYKKSLIVTLDANNKQRINYKDSPQFINGLIITAGKIQFRK